MDAPQKHPGGRPTVFRKEYVRIAHQLCRQHGYTLEKLADVLGVHLNTIFNWQNRHPEFVEAIRRGRDEFDSEHVESALLKRAKGFVRKRVTKRTVRRQGREHTEIVETVEEVAGSVRAQETWLFNRNPRRWKRAPVDDAGIVDAAEKNVLVVDRQEDWEATVVKLTGKTIAENEAEHREKQVDNGGVGST